MPYLLRHGVTVIPLFAPPTCLVEEDFSLQSSTLITYFWWEFLPELCCRHSPQTKKSHWLCDRFKLSYTNANMILLEISTIYFMFSFPLWRSLGFAIICLDLMDSLYRTARMWTVSVCACSCMWSVALWLFSNVCCRKPSRVDMLSQGQICLHKSLAAEERVKSTPLVIRKETSTIKSQETGLREFGTVV